MNARQKILLTLVIAEAVAAAGLALRRPAGRGLPPIPKAALDPVTAREVTALEDALQPDRAADWRRLAGVYRAFNLLNAADYCYGRAEALAPGSAAEGFDWAVTLSRMGDTQGARPLFERTLATGGPEAAECRLLLAQDRLRENDVTGAEKLLREIPDAPEATVLLARLLVRSGRAAEAATMLDRWLAANPDDLRARQMRAWAAEELGDLATAETQRQAAVRERDFGHRRDASSQRDEQVRQEFGRAQALAKVQQLETQGKWDEAAAALREQLAIAWGDQEARRLASAELSAGHADRAIAEIERLVQASGANGENQLLLANAWLARGDLDRAWAAAQRAERLGANFSPVGNLNVQQMLVNLCNRRNDAVGARRHQGRAQFELGKLAWLQDDVPQAHQQFLRASAIEPNHAPTWFYLGETSALLGDTARARASYTRCLELAPDHGRARVALARLQ
jgi:tetratricopeptide (TPR) repeat protein